MTEEEKRKRRDRIKSVNEARNKMSNTTQSMVYWVTRDSDVHGNLSEWVTVWLKRPTLIRVGNGVGWYHADGTVDSATGPARIRFAQWTLDQCYRACNVIPDTDRECIRVG
jgi:hypothetical protein